MKSGHFRKYSNPNFMYIIRYNNSSRRPHDPPRLPSQNRKRVAATQPPGLTPMTVPPNIKPTRQPT